MGRSDVSVRKAAAATAYLPRLNRKDADADFCLEVSKNADTIYEILSGDEVVGLCCIQDDVDAYLYIYIFPEHRHQGFGYGAVDAARQQLQSTPLQSIATAYDSKNEIATAFAEKCGFVKKSTSSVFYYRGEKFDIPELPIHKHRDEDFLEAFTMSSEAFHIMRMETGHDPNSVAYEPDEEMRQVCLKTADERYVYVQDGEIVGCAHIDGAEIDNVAIKISHQGKGLGKLLVKYLVNEILDKKIGEPFLFCLTVNKKAWHMYEALGFEEVVCNAYAVKKIADEEPS